MNTKTYTTLPQEAKDIRIKVFMKEQGFENEFDDIDQISSHIVVFDETKPVGTCRFFKENNHYTIGRVAVLKEYRNQHIGNLLLKSAEKEIKKLNGDLIVVHAKFVSAHSTKTKVIFNLVKSTMMKEFHICG